MEDKIVLTARALEKSDQALEDSDLLLQNDRLHSACNRIYYSIFYSVTALGYLHGFTTTKHSQLMGWFNKTCIYEKKLFSADTYKTHKEAYDLRQESDYDFLVMPERQNVDELFLRAKEFIQTVRAHIIESNLEIK